MSEITDKIIAFGATNGIDVPSTPADWFADKFPLLESQYGTAIQECHPPAKKKSEALPFVQDVNEDFIAATLGEHGNPQAPTVFVPTEERFYQFTPTDGIFMLAREAGLNAELSALLLSCARDCRDKFNVSNLEFKFRDTAALRGVISKAKGLLEVPPEYFESDLTEFVPAANGMLRLSDRALLPFGPEYRRRNKFGVNYVAGAECALFTKTLLEPALSSADIDLLQRWCGLALIGVNLAQRFLILTGTASGGKGTLIRVMQGIIGSVNVGSLRPSLLTERFEIGRLLGKTLLYGADVPANFLNVKGASVLKSLTGGDPVTAELKGSNEAPAIDCRFNCVVTCNSRLTVRLEGDADAWRRRLAIIQYERPKPDFIIADLSERIVAKEGAGVLNWMLDGLDKLRADGWQLVLDAGQTQRVDDLLLSSESDLVFLRECVTADADGSLTVAECFEAYVQFCGNRDWSAMSHQSFGRSIKDAVTAEFSTTQRNDVTAHGGKSQRGWKGIRLL